MLMYAYVCLDFPGQLETHIFYAEGVFFNSGGTYLIKTSLLQ